LLEIAEKDLIESLKFTPLQAKRMIREVNNLIQQYEQNLKGKKATAPPQRSRGRMQTKYISKKGVLLSRRRWVSVLTFYFPTGFKTGVWSGYYAYADGKQDPTSFDVTMIAGNEFYILSTPLFLFLRFSSFSLFYMSTICFQ
jgi:hypothetical protein